MIDKFQEASSILRHFADKFGYPVGDSFIAGGWAMCPFRADDIDIWITRPGIELDNEGYRRLGNLLYGQSTMDREFDVALDITTNVSINWYGKSVQIFETPYTLTELLSHFDLSCHQYAIADVPGEFARGVQCFGENVTHPINEKIVVLTADHTSAHRLEKLLRRYDHNE